MVLNKVFCLLFQAPQVAERTWFSEQQSRLQPQMSSSHQPTLTHQPFILQPGAYAGPNARMIIPAHSPIPYAVAMPPGPIASPIPHGSVPRTHTPHGQPEGDLQLGQQGLDARYSSFRAQLPRGTVFINDKRMPIPILPATASHGYPYLMHPGTAIRYGPLHSPDQFAHARIPSVAIQPQHRGYIPDPTRQAQIFANGQNPPDKKSPQVQNTTPAGSSGMNK